MIDKVCSTLPTCVVLVVSGRPQILTGRLGRIDGLVASWLPGTEGAGVADVLFGRRPFTGALPQTWPRRAGQEPINVGDQNYRPLFPFGWGLRTAPRGGGRAGATGIASPRDLRQAARLTRGDGPGVRGQKRLVEILRGYVQLRVLDPSTGVPPVASDAIARADVATLRGDYATAVDLLLKALPR